MARKVEYWSEPHKARFRQLIKSKKIDPKNLNKDYIEKVRLKYWPERPYRTFVTNYKASAGQWHIGRQVDEYNRGK